MVGNYGADARPCFYTEKRGMVGRYGRGISSGLTLNISLNSL
jgi:hypothetical protein